LFMNGELTRTATARVPARVTGPHAERALLDAVQATIRAISEPDRPLAVSIIEDPRLPPIPGKSSFRATGSLGYAYGVAAAAMRGWFGPGIHAYTAAAWKGGYKITGDRTARTSKAQQFARMMWPKHEFGTDDEVDAALLGAWAIQTQWMKTITGAL
jgi:hypothetical protein